MNPSLNQIMALFQKKDYRFFSEPHKLNLVGIRSHESESDKFDDEIHAIFHETKIAPFTHLVFPCTTDPGKHWLLNPMNIKGCAIMIPGQYVDAYHKGLHKGGYPALVQAAPIWFVRDNNRDNKLDFSLYSTALKINGFFQVIGANIHRASALKKAFNVGAYSAACQVLQNDADLTTILKLADNQIMSGGGINFTYTLTEEKDFL